VPVNTAGAFQKITLSEAYTNFTYLVFHTLSGKCTILTSAINSTVVHMTTSDSICSNRWAKDPRVYYTIFV
jgi:hypothetical protein